MYVIECNTDEVKERNRMIVKEDGLPSEHETVYLIRKGLEGTPYHRVRLDNCKWIFFSGRIPLVVSENDQWYDNYGEALTETCRQRKLYESYS